MMFVGFFGENKLGGAASAQAGVALSVAGSEQALRSFIGILSVRYQSMNSARLFIVSQW